MAYKCPICGLNDVANPGDICELCAIGQDPYASAVQKNDVNRMKIQNTNNNDVGGRLLSKGKSRKVLLNVGATLNNTDLCRNTIVSHDDEPVQVFSAGQAPAIQDTSINSNSKSNIKTKAKEKKSLVNNEPITSGITKNIYTDTQETSIFSKLGRTLFKGIPFALDDDITMFQVFPDYSGTTLNSMGNVCDQVIVYGKLTAGAVAENNDIEVYGHRDANNYIIAKRIVNKASGTSVTPERIIPAMLFWCAILAAIAFVFMFISQFSIEGIIWTVIIILCLMNLPFVFKLILGLFGFLFSIIRRIL